MAVLLLDLLRLRLVEVLVRAAVADLLLPGHEERRIAAVDALRAHEEVAAVVRTRRADVVDERERLALRRVHEAGVDVALHHPLRMAVERLAVDADNAVVRREVRLAERLERRALRLHRDEVLEAVAAVDVEAPPRRDEPVRGIVVAVVLHVAVDAPEHAVARVVLERALVVLVADLRLHDLAELPLLDEVEHEHLLLAVRAVLQHHAVAAELLGGLHGRPAFLEVERAGHLLQHVLAVRHRVDVDRAVERTRRGGIHDVADVRVAQALPRVLVAVAAPFLRRGVAVLLHPLLDRVEAHGVDVRDRRHLASGDLRDALHGRRAARAHADEAHAHALHRRHAEPVHRRARGASRPVLRRLGGQMASGHRRHAHPGRSLQKLSSALVHGVSLFLTLFKILTCRRGCSLSCPQPFGEQAIIHDISVVALVKEFVVEKRVKRKAHA